MVRKLESNRARRGLKIIARVAGNNRLYLRLGRSLFYLSVFWLSLSIVVSWV